MINKYTEPKEKLRSIPEIIVQKVNKEMRAFDLEQSKQHAFLKNRATRSL